MPLYMHRVATVVSLKQLREDTAAQNVVEAEGGPLAPVATVAGLKLPRYCFAATSSAKMPRTSSADDAFAHIPDVDDDR